jgi:hypothetical protein
MQRTRIGQKHNCRLTSSTEGRVHPCRSCWHELQKKESNSLTSSLVRFTQLKWYLQNDEKLEPAVADFVDTTTTTNLQ